MTELSNFVRWYDNAMPADVCDKMIEAFENSPGSQIANGANARAGLEESAWTEIDITKLSDRASQEYVTDLIVSYKKRYEQDCGISPELPLPSALAPLVLKRYRSGEAEQFQPHFDSIREVCNRYLVFLWYVNDVAEGGETEFVDLDIKVKPVKGRLLIFPPYWMYRHAGLQPTSNDKYILSTYALW